MTIFVYGNARLAQDWRFPYLSCERAWIRKRSKESGINSSQLKPKQAGHALVAESDLVYAAFKEDQYQRRSFLFKLLDGSVAKELGLDNFFGGYFDE